eukprot:TRINITY_DN9861_c0_g1_i5.p1 TRINITY_DN9861_c0_g1~~TRINITY_DN9861_c0_g1_i5.p1  ORF type:complete len:508 (+),score=146.18 TRINITY_DN9861_c0_g1_i5:378-1901(+)
MKPPHSNASKKKRRRRKKQDPASASPQQEKEKGGEDMDNDEENERKRSFNCLVEAFSSFSFDEVVSAYEAAEGDANKAAVILSAELMGVGEVGDGVKQEGEKSEKGGRRKKAVTASTGMVSSVLGKGYVWTGSRRNGFIEPREVKEDQVGREEAEEFLFSMLGVECQLDFGVIRDVFCQCGYDVEKALDTLLELSASSNDMSTDNVYGSSSKNSSCDTSFFLKGYSSVLANDITRKCQAAEDSTLLSEKELYKVESARYDHRDDTEAMFNCDEHLLSRSGVTKSYLPQKVLESLFSIPEGSKHEQSSMDWKRVVKKMASFGQEFQFLSDSIPKPKQDNGHAKEDDYQVLRTAARQHWDTTKSFYQRAATAYSRGERGHAAYLSEQGRFYHRKAREADEKASQEIFEVRNKDIKNAFTIDLHGQQVKQAIRLLKLHLILFTHIPSIQFLTVITGCGSHGVGKETIKQSVIGLVKKEGIEWSEKNRGAIVIRLDGRKEFSFLQSDSDSE